MGRSVLLKDFTHLWVAEPTELQVAWIHSNDSGAMLHQRDQFFANSNKGWLKDSTTQFDPLIDRKDSDIFSYFHNTSQAHIITELNGDAYRTLPRNSTPSAKLVKTRCNTSASKQFMTFLLLQRIVKLPL